MALFEVESNLHKYGNQLYVIASDYTDAQRKALAYIEHTKKAKSIFEYDKDGASSIRRDLYDEEIVEITQIKLLSKDVIQ